MADAVKPSGALSFDLVDGLIDWLLGHPRDVLGSVMARYRDGRVRDAERISAAAVALFPDDGDVWFQHGMVAIHLRDWAKAAERFAAVRERFPDHAPAYSYGGMALRSAGRVAEAEALLRGAVTAFPGDWRVLVEYAQCAGARGAVAELIERCELVVKCFPERPEGHWMLSGAFMQMGRLNEAEAAIGEGIARNPDERFTLFVWARCATARKDWPEATRRWEMARSRHPDQSQIEDGYMMMRMQAAENDARPFIEYAKKAPPEGPRDEAIRRWGEVRRRFPSSADGHWALTLELIRAGRLEEAEAAAQEGMRHVPDDAFMLWQWGRVAAKRHDWAEAEHRWQVAKARHPRSAYINEGIAEMHLARQLLGLGPAAAPAAHEVDPALGKLLAGFESIGDNCEFGIVQRLAGIEPLGLLRWANIPLPRLMQILSERFAGVGDPANTALELKTSEYHLVDLRYFGMHTFVNVGQTSEEEFFPKMCRRLRFLKDKLIEDLTEGEKIFVYKSTYTAPTIAEMRLLKAAIGRYGNATLLCVQRPPSPGLDQSLEVVEDGLLAGYLSKLTPNPQAVRDYAADWFALCRETARIAAVSPGTTARANAPPQPAIDA